MIDREEVIEDTKPVTEVKPEDLDKMYSKVDEITDVKDVVSDMTIDLKIEKPNFWSTKCEFNFKFSQNYFSEQWYKGGNNNVHLFTASISSPSSACEQWKTGITPSPQKLRHSSCQATAATTATLIQTSLPLSTRTWRSVSTSNRS